MSVGLSVCLSDRISPEPHARSLPNFCACCLCMLPMQHAFLCMLARSSFDTFTIGRIAYRREGVFFPIDNAYISGTTRAIFAKFFMHVAYVRSSDILRHVYDRPHRLSPGRVFFPTENALSAGKRGLECTARATYAIYHDCLVSFLKPFTEIEHRSSTARERL